MKSFERVHSIRLLVWNRCRQSALLALALVAVVITPHLVQAEESASDFMRLRRGASGEIASLDTSIVRYRGVSPYGSNVIEVDLISAVHIGSNEYYDQLNSLFKGYDALLYELIAPKDHEFQMATPSPSPLSKLQLGITNLLGLQFQLDRVDYTAHNFVHADLSPEEFTASMRERGETIGSILLKLLTSTELLEDSQRSQANQIVMLFTLIQRDSPERQLRLRRLLAKELQEVERFTEAINGEEGSTILTTRNDRALAVLKEQIESGKRTFGIFYGGAHMPDLAEKLRRDFKLEPTQTTWITAWPLEH